MQKRSNLAEKKGQDEGFVLLTRPWRETSLMVECFTLNHGRQMMMARGARRPQSVLRGLILPFHRILWHWRGSGEVVNLSRAEWLGKISFMPRHALFAAHYLNELIHRLLAFRDPHPLLYHQYINTLMALGKLDTNDLEPLNKKIFIEASLRRFEVCLLKEIGYQLRLDETAEEPPLPIKMDKKYIYKSSHGLVANTAGNDNNDYLHGDSALEMHSWLQNDNENSWQPSSILLNPDNSLRRLAEQKKLLRRLLHEFLNHQPLGSRKVLHQIEQLKL